MDNHNRNTLHHGATVQSQQKFGQYFSLLGKGYDAIIMKIYPFVCDFMHTPFMGIHGSLSGFLAWPINRYFTGYQPSIMSGTTLQGVVA